VGARASDSPVDDTLVGGTDDAVDPSRASYRTRSPNTRLRKGLAIRISALVLLVVAATAGSAVVTLVQLRALRVGFDRLTEVYVQFNQHLASAHVQAMRVGEQVQSRSRDNVELGTKDPAAPTDSFLLNFEEALEVRNAAIAEARAPVDGALDDPGRFGGKDQLELLQEIQSELDELERLAQVGSKVDPARVLDDVRRQGQIEQVFKQLATRSSDAIEELRRGYQDTQVLAQWLTLGLTLGVTIAGVLAAAGVFLTLRPLRRLSESVRNLGKGDWSERIDASVTTREDEVGHLAGEFNDMAAALESRERLLLRGERLAAAGQLAAQITHEIRNPLSSVALYAELLEDELPGGASEGRELLSKITTEVERLTSVTEDYLAFARRPQPQRRRVDLVAELQNLLEFMQPAFCAVDLQVSTDFPEDPVEILVDPNQLRQAFMNLLRNASEALVGEDPGEATPDPRLALSVRCKGDRVTVVVQDNGPGIGLPENELDTIFEAFVTHKARGTGLGLPTVQQILQDHDGHVQVAKTGDTGTTFEVMLPLADAPEPP